MKGACRSPKRGSRFRTPKTTKHQSTPTTPSFKRRKERPREGTKVARDNTPSGQRKKTRCSGRRGAGRASRRLPRPRVHRRANPESPGAARYLPRDPALGASSPAKARLQLYPRTRGAVQVSPRGCQRKEAGASSPLRAAGGRAGAAPRSADQWRSARSPPRPRHASPACSPALLPLPSAPPGFSLPLGPPAQTSAKAPCPEATSSLCK